VRLLLRALHIDLQFRTSYFIPSYCEGIQNPIKLFAIRYIPEHSYSETPVWETFKSGTSYDFFTNSFIPSAI